MPESPPPALGMQPANDGIMVAGSTKNDGNPSEPPLWSIGIAMLIILLAPLVLYSLAPTGPLRDGDTVFADGEQRVRISKAVSNPPYEMGETCLLDPNGPLIVIRTPNDEPDNSFIAQVQGNPSPERPFCPVHAHVRLTTNQVFQKPAVFETIREMLAR